MEKTLTAKQQHFLGKLESKLKLEKVKANTFSIFQKNKNFTMPSPTVFKIEGTDSYLIFGDFVSYDIEKIKQQLEMMQRTHQNENLENKNDNLAIQELNVDSETDKKGEEERNNDTIADENVCKNENVKESVATKEMDNEKKIGLNMNETQMREEAIEFIMDHNNASRVRAIAVLTDCEFDVNKAMERFESESK